MVAILNRKGSEILRISGARKKNLLLRMRSEVEYVFRKSSFRSLGVRVHPMEGCRDRMTFGVGDQSKDWVEIETEKVSVAVDIPLP